MAVLEKIRVKFGLVISIIIALALLSFIIDPSTLESALSSMSSKNDVGKINGKSISYTAFTELEDRYNTLYGGNLRSEDQRAQLRDEVWMDLVDKYLFIKKAEEAGIIVGESEMEKLTMGDNPSLRITMDPRQFFMGQDGVYDPARLVEFLQSMPSDESGLFQLYWDYLYNKVYADQYRAKYAQLYLGSSVMNDLQKRRLLTQNNTFANVDYVFVPNPAGTDSSIVVSDSEIKQYYEDHKKNFFKKANRDIEYVSFEVTPSPSDIEKAGEEFSNDYDEFCVTEDVQGFLSDKESLRAYEEYWYRNGELRSVNSELGAFVDENNEGTSPIVKQDYNNTFYAARIMEVKPIPDSVYVKCIILDGADAAKADSIATVAAKGEDFSALAAQYSVNQQIADGGVLGNLGWMTQNNIRSGWAPREFNVFFTSELNAPKVIPFGEYVFVAMSSEKTEPVIKKRVAIFEKKAEYSQETYDKVSSEATAFADDAGKDIESFRQAAKNINRAPVKMNITEATSNYGSVNNAKEVTRWAFEAKEGNVSEKITVNTSSFFVVAVDKTRKEGIQKIEEVSEDIKRVLYPVKLAAAREAYVAEQIKGMDSLEAIAEKLGESVESNASLPLGFSPERGVDAAFAGAVFAAMSRTGQISGPVAGRSGVYVFKVNSTGIESSFTEDDARKMALQFTTGYNIDYLRGMGNPIDVNMNLLAPVYSTMAGNEVVKDNRARFF